MPRSNTRSAILAPTGVKDPAAQRVLQSIYEHLNGAPTQETVDQLSQRVAALGQSGGDSSSSSSATQPARPDVPKNLVAAGIFGGVILKIDAMPASARLIEWLAAPDDNVGHAVVVATTAVPLFQYYTGDDETRYFWARAVGFGNNPLRSALNSTDGTKGTPAKNVDLVLNSITNAVSTDELTKELVGRINLIDGSKSLPGSVNSRLNTVVVQSSQRYDALSARLNDSNTAAELGFDTEPPGTVMLPDGWRAHASDAATLQKLGYVNALDDSIAAYGILTGSAADWSVSKCWHLAGTETVIDGSFIEHVESGQFFAMVRFYDINSVRLKIIKGTPSTEDGEVKYSFPVPSIAAYFELVIVAGDYNYADTIPVWFKGFGADAAQPVPVDGLRMGDALNSNPITVYS